MAAFAPTYQIQGGATCQTPVAPRLRTSSSLSPNLSPSACAHQLYPQNRGGAKQSSVQEPLRPLFPEFVFFQIGSAHGGCCLPRVSKGTLATFHHTSLGHRQFASSPPLRSHSHCSLLPPLPPLLLHASFACTPPSCDHLASLAEPCGASSAHGSWQPHLMHMHHPCRHQDT